MANKCENCTEKCLQAERANQVVLGRMYATKKFTALLKKVESGELVEVVHGRWVHKGAWHIECSECKHVLAHIDEAKNYCPNCGAKMDGDGNDTATDKT